MKRISIELNATLNKKLKKYIHAHYESAFGKQEIVLHDALVEFLNAHGTSQPQVEEIEEVLIPAGASAKPKAKKVKAKKTPSSQRKPS
jgi:hypothetical protein